MNSNILRTYELATPEQTARGLAWYESMNRWTHTVARLYNFTPEQTAGVIAILSPRNYLTRNLQDTIKVLTCIRRGWNPGTISLHSTNSNKYKAFQFARGELQTVPGIKVSSFYDNILHPHTSARVTVDVWAIRVYLGDYTCPVKPITPRLYRAIESEYIESARVLEISPVELQAITWVTARDTAGTPYKIEYPKVPGFAYDF